VQNSILYCPRKFTSYAGGHKSPLMSPVVWLISTGATSYTWCVYWLRELTAPKPSLSTTCCFHCWGYHCSCCCCFHCSHCCPNSSWPCGRGGGGGGGLVTAAAAAAAAACRGASIAAATGRCGGVFISAVQECNVLVLLHGLLVQDLKSANILLTEERRAKVGDVVREHISSFKRLLTYS
jgi:hypothetical protein